MDWHILVQTIINQAGTWISDILLGLITTGAAFLVAHIKGTWLQGIAATGVTFAEDAYANSNGDIKLKAAADYISDHSTFFGIKFIDREHAEALARSAYQRIITQLDVLKTPLAPGVAIVSTPPSASASGQVVSSFKVGS